MVSFARIYSSFFSFASEVEIRGEALEAISEKFK
jgi:hypothetical protein